MINTISPLSGGGKIIKEETKTGIEVVWTQKVEKETKEIYITNRNSRQNRESSKKTLLSRTFSVYMSMK